MSEERVTPGTANRPEFPAERQGWFAVAVLCFAYALVMVDWQLIVFLADPIRADLAINDFQFSLITGFLVVAVSVLAGIPIARYADSGDRREVVAVAVALWSLMTVLSSRAFGIFLLLFARFGSGVGRAALVPASLSLICDSFSAERRPLAINVYACGAFVGLGLAHALSGFIVTAAASAEGLLLPLTGRFSGWQLAFLIVALPGVIVLALLRRMPEPARHRELPDRREAQLRETISYVRKDWFGFVSLIIGAVLSGIGLFAVFAWVPTVFLRVYEWSPPAIGLTFGLVTILFGTAGLILSGRSASRFVAQGQTHVYQRLMMLAVACAIIPGAFTMIVDSAAGMWACLAAVIFFLAMPVGLALAAIQLITPNSMRAQLTAVWFAAMNIIGLAIGPVAVAAISDFVFRSDMAIDRALGVVIVASGVASVLLLALGVKQYEQKGRAR